MFGKKLFWNILRDVSWGFLVFCSSSFLLVEEREKKKKKQEKRTKRQNENLNEIDQINFLFLFTYEKNMSNSDIFSC